MPVLMLICMVFVSVVGGTVVEMALANHHFLRYSTEHMHLFVHIVYIASMT